MLGKILKIDGRIIKVENLKKISMINIIGYYVVFEDIQKLVGEIIFVNEDEFHIVLVGEIKNEAFIPGVENFPPITSTCRVVYKNELEYIIGSQDIISPKNLLLGRSMIYDGFNISVNVSDFFSNHFAIIGNSGSGKSCGIARMLQNLFADNKQNPINSHIIIFDVYGEYKSALMNINNHQGINVKNYSTSTGTVSNSNIISIPPYLLEAEDLALLLNVTDSSLLSVLDKALAYVKIFKGEESVCLQYKNDIVAKSLLDILSSGKPAQQISDQAIAFLTKYYTSKINLETVMVQPGYNRTIRQCLNVDASGKVAALELLIEYCKNNSGINIEKLNLNPTEYTFEDLYDALELAIVSEGVLNSDYMYERLNTLKARLHSIITGPNKKFFEYSGFISRANYIRQIFSVPSGEKAQIIDIDFNGIDDRLARVIVKILSKMFYNYATSLEEKGSYPINILIEEAHRYIMNDNDVDVIGYNIFDKIAKEGRKYGIILGLITQRFSELSANVLSQCSNFIIFRMYYPEDIKMISSIVSNINTDIIERVKSLRKGSALLIGTSFHLPLITQFEIPNPMPTSLNVDIHAKWYESIN